MIDCLFVMLIIIGFVGAIWLFFYLFINADEVKEWRLKRRGKKPTKKDTQLEKIARKFIALEQMREFWSGINNRPYTNIWVNKNNENIKINRLSNKEFCLARTGTLCASCFLGEYFDDVLGPCERIYNPAIYSSNPDNVVKRRLDAVEAWLKQKYGAQIKQRKTELDELDQMIANLETDWDDQTEKRKEKKESDPDILFPYA